MKKKILILGGNGFVGTHLTRVLVRENTFEITLLSRGAPEKLIPNTRWARGDITDLSSILPHFQEQEIVINCAGKVAFSKKEIKELYEINFLGAKNALLAAEKTPSVQRFLHISSTAALGFGDHLITEESPFHWEKWKAVLPYSYSKYLANSAIQQSRLATNIIFPSLILGPDDPLHTKKILRPILNNWPIPAPPGMNSVIDARDLAEGVFLILTKAPPKENYILAGYSCSFAALFHAAKNAASSHARIFSLPAPFLTPLYSAAKVLESCGIPIASEPVFLGFQKRMHNTEKIKNLGFLPAHTLEESFRDSIQHSRKEEI